MYSRGLFPDGDRGANRIKTDKLSNLHSAWDRSFGGRSFRSFSNVAIDHLADDRYDGLIEKAAKSLKPETWLDESFELAKEHAYNREIIEQLKDREANGDDLALSPHAGPLENLF